ncbi:ferrichrome-type siderophore transporter [Panaeolus papilionaceus]|nr:ferrichrome-type siderophore transporter [Panaeolus papilionaceus]
MSGTQSTSRPYTHETSSIGSESTAHMGVRTVEAVHKVLGKYTRWALFISLGLAAYIYSLDGTTTYTYLQIAASYMDHHSLIGTISVAQAIIVAVGKPVVAKIADVRSRGFAYVLVLFFYVIGYIIIASAKNIETIAGGIILYAVGYTGLQLLTQIVIADITTLQWRSLMSALMTLPFVINVFVGSNISTSMIKKGPDGWRWGYGMFAILVPAALAPLIVTLLWAQRKAKRLNLIPQRDASEPIFVRMKDEATKLNIFGLLLLGTSVALILLPMTLAENAEGGWDNPSMIAMIVIGFVIFPAFVFWESRAKFPVVPVHFFKNRSFLIAASVGFFDFISFYISYTYLFSFVFIVKPWSLVNMTYFSYTQTLSLTIFAIVAGIIMRFTHRAKPLLIAGLSIRLLGCGLMIHSRGANASDAEIVWSQLLQGIGGGFAAIASQTSAQASVPHIDVAVLTASVLLITEIGGAIGSAIAGAIWTHLMPGRLAFHLPFVPEADRQVLYGSILAASTFPRDSPVRLGAIAAYDDVMKVMTITATAVAVIPWVLAFLMPNWYLGEQQNAIDNTDLKGEKVVNPDVDGLGSVPTAEGQRESDRESANLDEKARTIA